MTIKGYNRRHFIGTLTGAMLNAGIIPDASAQNKDNRRTHGHGNGETIDIIFAGTGAADWPSQYPAPGQSVERGGFRGNASVILDSTVMIDCGPTVPDALIYYGIDTGSLTDLLITHSHGDHVNGDALIKLASSTENDRKIRIRGDSLALERAMPPDSFGIYPLECMTTIQIGGLNVTALPANHIVANSRETPLHYLIEKNGKRLLYATDGAWLLKPTWLYLRDKPLDAVIWDATIGEVEGDWRIFEHNSLEMVRLMNRTLMAQNVLKPNAQIILTHMARTLWAPHAEVEKRLAPEKIIPAWDGMRVEV